MISANPHTPSLLLAATAKAVSAQSAWGGGKSLIFNSKEVVEITESPCVMSITGRTHGLFCVPAVAHGQEATLLSPLRP